MRRGGYIGSGRPCQRGRNSSRSGSKVALEVDTEVEDGKKEEE